MGSNDLTKQYIQLLDVPADAAESVFVQHVIELRRLVLFDGIPEEPWSATTKGSTLRGMIWKMLLGVHHVDATEYISLLSCGPSSFAADIEKDLKRTLSSDPELATRAPLESRMRLLNAFFHWLATYSSTPSESKFDTLQCRGYSQGMGSLVAVLLYVLPEVEAFAAFRCLMIRIVPRWYSASSQSLRKGCLLADKIVQELDPSLHRHLMSLFGPASSHAELMFFSRISSLFANRPPLSSIVRLWDAILAFGVQFVVVLCAAEALIRREELLAAGRDSVTRFQGIGSPSAAKLLNPSTMTLVALELVTHVSPEILILLDKFASEQLNLHAPSHIRSYARPLQDSGKPAAAWQHSGTGSRSASLSRTAVDAKRVLGTLESLGSESGARSRSVAPRTAPRYLQLSNAAVAHHPSSSMGGTEASSRRVGAQGAVGSTGTLQLLLNAKSAIKARSQLVNAGGTGYKMAATRALAPKPGAKTTVVPIASKITIQRTRAAQVAAGQLTRAIVAPTTLALHGKSNADTYAGK